MGKPECKCRYRSCLVAHRRTLLVLDGLEPLQNPPGPQEGRLREPGLQALLRELAAFNMGLCVDTLSVILLRERWVNSRQPLVGQISTTVDSVGARRLHGREVLGRGCSMKLAVAVRAAA